MPRTWDGTSLQGQRPCFLQTRLAAHLHPKSHSFQCGASSSAYQGQPLPPKMQSWSPPYWPPRPFAHPCSCCWLVWDWRICWQASPWSCTFSSCSAWNPATGLNSWPLDFWWRRWSPRSVAWWALRWTGTCLWATPSPTAPASPAAGPLAYCCLSG